MNNRMKATTLFFGALLLSLSIKAQSNDKQSGDGNNYCVQAGVNKMVVIYESSPIIEDAKLDNGTIVKPDGTLVLKNGNKILLREGQCINRDGTINYPQE